MDDKPIPVVLGPGAGAQYAPAGHPQAVVKADGGATAGAYSLLELTVAGAGPPPHVHHVAAEAFYVLEGAVSIRVGADTVWAAAGAFVLVPPGTPHTFANAGAAPARMLTIFSPPGFEQFFARTAALDEPPGSPEFLAKVQEIRQSLGTDLADLGG